MGNNLHSACHSGDLRSVKYYLTPENINEIDYCNGVSMTPLMIACYRGYKNIVEYLIAEGADLTIEINNEISALTLAAEYGKNYIVETLVKAIEEEKSEHKVKPNWRFILNKGLKKACDSDYPYICLYLLQKGAEWPTDDNDIFLRTVSGKNENDIFDDIFDDLFIDFSSTERFTLLELICRLNKVELLEKLCKEKENH